MVQYKKVHGVNWSKTKNERFDKRELKRKETISFSLTQSQINSNSLQVRVWFIRGYVLMILPQVHLRKPCYDFYFL